ncbi:MAG: asparagine synthase (glutamine-hydrolyzing) [Phycisphaerales bacterium]
MCGLAGIIVFSRADAGGDGSGDSRAHAGADALVAIPESWLDLLDAKVRHRGPDGAGRYRADVVTEGVRAAVAMVHRRLSIIDGEGGAQPMVSRTGPARSVHAASELVHGPAPVDGRGGELAVVFNGCIYNHRELRRELSGLGHVFVTSHSDTEVLLHGYRQWGQGVIDKLEGMFAFALVDRANATLVLARDRFGEKPLFLTPVAIPSTGGAVQAWAFASTAAALIPFAQRTLSGEGGSMDEWLRFGFGADLPGLSISAVAPASSLCITGEGGGRIELRDHWFCMEGTARTFPRRDEPLDEDTVDRLVTRAVESRLEADVPLGCFLSGGVDSALVAAIARRALGRLETFTVEMPVAAYDESAAASAAAGHIGSTHHTLSCRASPAADVQMLIEQMGVPLGDSSLLPTHWVSRAARDVVKVALSGDGGDELFCGYERYGAADMLMGPMRRLLSILPAALLPRHDPKALTTKLARLIGAAGGSGYTDLVSIFPSRPLRKLLGRQERARAGRWAWHGAGNAMAWDISNYLPGDLLCKSDGASMACGLEVRAPLLDRALSVAAMSAPLPTLCPGRVLKGLLRNVAARYLPREHLQRPKMGFAIPIGPWFRSDFGGLRTLLHETLLSVEPFGPAWLGIDVRLKSVERLMRAHEEREADHGQQLYLLLMMALWAQMVGRTPRAPGL